VGNLPKSIGPYRIQSELGRGMMGVVYKATDTRSKKAVALKVIRLAMAVSDEQEKTFERRFVEEAQIVARLDHPCIVAVYEIGRDPEEKAPFIAFEYLEGRTLAARLEEGALPWKEALRLTSRVAAALHHAHEQGVIHRDIKPANIMLLSSGEPKLMDFGLAKRDAGVELTSTGQFLGTPLYMSPEQALGRKVDARTDVFSLGCVAYTMLTGKRAFEAESIPQVMNKVTYQHPPRPSQVKRKLPADVDYLVARAMAKSPDDRYATAEAFGEDLEDVLAGKKPRHRAGWTSPALNEGTMVSEGRPAGDEDTGPLGEGAPHHHRRSAGPVAFLGLGMLTLGALLYSSAFWKEHLGGLGDGGLPPATLALPPDTEAAHRRVPEETAAPAPSEAPLARPSAEPTAVPTDTPTAEPPTPAPAAAQTPTRAPKDMSRLSVTFEHSLKSGTLRIWVDKELVHEETLRSRVTKDMLVFKQRSGKAQESLPVEPGKRHVRVEVRSDGDVRSREIWATFKAGVTRRLDVRLKGDKLELGWR
jgi:tRNA A-37 threonylcarbamoyl transferase component Bud32